MQRNEDENWSEGFYESSADHHHKNIRFYPMFQAYTLD
jgi:hypothetical protein